MLYAGISSRYPRYRDSIGDYHLLYDQVEIDRWKQDWGSAFFDADICKWKKNH